MVQRASSQGPGCAAIQRLLAACHHRHHTQMQEGVFYPTNLFLHFYHQLLHFFLLSNSPIFCQVVLSIILIIRNSSQLLWLQQLLSISQVQEVIMINASFTIIIMYRPHTATVLFEELNFIFCFVHYISKVKG